MPRKYLSNRERILLHLSSHSGEVGYFNAPISLTQEGIADNVGIGRNNVPREIKKLMEDGYVDTQKARVTGLRNKRNVYYLTPAGVKKVSEIKEKLENLGVNVLTEEGTEEFAIMRELPEKYGVNFIAAALNLNKDKTLDLISVRKERSVVHYIEENSVIGRFYGRRKELELLKHWLHSNRRILVVHGLPGIGKTLLMVKFIKNYARTKNVFFIRISKNDTPFDVAYRLGKFYSKLGRPSLERYMRTVIRNGREFNHCEYLRNIVIKTIRDEILIFDSVENATPVVKNAIRWFAAAVDERKRVRLVIIGTNVHGMVPISKLPHTMDLKLDELPAEDAYRLLKEFGVGEEKARTVVEKYGGNPLVLSLLSSNGEAGIREYIFDEVLGSLSKEERRIVEYLSVFTKPVDKGAFLKYGMEYPAIYTLITKSIVKEHEYDIYTLPRLISRFVYERLSDKKKTMYNMMAGEYYEYRHEFLDAANHFLRGGDALRAESIISERHRDYIYQRPGLLKNLAFRILNAEGYVSNRDWIMHGIIGEILLLEGKWDEAKEYIYRAMSLAENKDMNEWAYYGVKLSTAMGKEGDIAEAMSLVKRILEQEQNIEKKEYVAMAYYVLGNLLRIRGDVETALTHLEKAVQVAEKTRNMDVLGFAYNGMGIIMRRRGDQGAAMEYYKRAKAAFEISGDDLGKIKVHRNIGYILYLQNDPACEAHFKDALSIAKKIGDMFSEGLVYGDLGAWYLAQGKLDDALEYLLKSKSLLESIRPAEDLAWLYNKLGIFYGYMGNKKEAARYFDMALEIAEEEGYPQLKESVKKCKEKYVENYSLREQAENIENNLPEMAKIKRISK